MVNKKEVLEDLEFICKSVQWEYKTLIADCMNLNYHIRRAVERCYSYGVTRWEVEEVLKKYLNTVRRDG